jgi:NAD(P)-dependent dehydrogenase (short-subunit alcohol dehydrogenase family)
MELELAGKKALITGGSKGIGLACAHRLAAEGVDLALAAREVGPLKEATRELRLGYGVEVSSHSCDLARPDHQEALMDVAGDVDILVNNAGPVPAGDLQTIDDQTLREAWDVKVFGYINLCRRVLPAMERRGSGVVVNIIGTAADHPSGDFIAGSAADAALVNFTAAQGAASFHHGVRVVGVSPGLTLTERLIGSLQKQSLDRFGTVDRWEDLLPDDPPPARPEQIADVVVFVASARAGYLTGTTIVADGGSGRRSVF